MARAVTSAGASPASRGRAFLGAVAVLGWIALALQFWLAVPVSIAGGSSHAGAVVWFFSFFTVLTNTLMALSSSVLAFAPQSRYGALAARPTVRAALVPAAVLVFVGYEALLRHRWNPTGSQFVADLLLHDVLPVLYLLGWLFFAPKGGLRPRQVLVWLVYPAVYLVYVLVRGAFTARYPYPFLDVGALGAARVATNVLVLLVGFLLVGQALVALDRCLARRTRSARGP